MDNQFYHNSKFNLVIDKSQIPNAGLGVYTLDFIPKNTLIDEYYGRLSTHSIGGEYVLYIDEKNCVDAFDFPRCFMAMINDCSFIPRKFKKKKGKRRDITPKEYLDKNNQILKINCFFNNDIINKKGYVYTLIDINPGEELFISYGPTYWS